MISSSFSWSAGEHHVRVPVSVVSLEGTLLVPPEPRGVVLFAHGSGSSRHSPRNRYVAQVLRQAGLVTLLLDLLTSQEEIVDQRTRHYRFNIGLLAQRLVGATDWLAAQEGMAELPVGYFGSSTGAAAALIAAVERPMVVQAIVSRGGRVDLATPILERVQAPTLLIVGEYDELVLNLNRDALEHLRVEKQLRIIPEATHLFEEPGALEQVAEDASLWFTHYLYQKVLYDNSL